jgi:hypothetical protein
MTGILPKQKKQINFLQILAIITLAFHVFTLFFIIYQGLLIRNLTNRKPPTFIELINGKPVTSNNILERNPEAIRQFVITTMTAMFNWSGTLPPQNIEDATNPKPDLGITVKTPQGYNKKIASSSWVAGFALSEDFRQGFIAQIADMTPSDIFIRNTNNQRITGQLLIQRVYPPENIAPGKWRVGIVANIVQQRSDNKKTITPLNKDFLVRAVDAYEHPLIQEITPLQKAVYRLRMQKLEIYNITDLCLNDTSSRCQQIFHQNQFTN